MKNSQLSRYGAISNTVGQMNPGAKFFFVGPSSAAWWGDFVQLFGPDDDGDTRVFSSLETAINDSAVVASRGDVIFLTPGYTQTISGATSLDFDKAGIQIIGLGNGSNKPTFTFTATDSRIDVTAANIKLQNVRLVAGVADIVTAFLHATAAQNTQYIDIEFTASAAFNFINCYTLGAANISDGCKWERNYLRTADTGQLALCITAAAHNDLKFYDNYVVHAAAAAGLLTAGAAELLGLDVRGNFVQTGQTDGSVGVLVITTGTASSGRIVDNDMKTADAAANVAIPIASKVYAARNYIAGADEVGTVIAVGTLFDNT
jgi:hypothetical protein